MIVHKSKNCLKCKHMKDCKLSPEGCSQFERVDQTPDKSTNALANLKTTSGELEKRALEYADHGVSSPLLTNTIKRLIAERNSLKARLEAVVKKLEDMRNYCVFDCVDREDVDAILRAARGESENENK